MDNGQRGITIKPSDGFKKPDEGFFTPGVGNIPAEDNTYKPEDNLDEENWQKALDISKPVDLPSPTEATGNSDITEAKESEKPPIIPETDPKHPTDIPKLPNFNLPKEEDPKLGQIATLENSINLPEVKKSSSYNPDSIKTTGDKLETSSITEVDNAIAELSQTGNLSNFYEEIRNMTETNLDNSFNRKLYQNNTGGDK